MLHKTLLLSALLSTSILASDYAYELTPVIGYDLQEGNTDIDNQFLIGAEMQFDKLTPVIKPELSLLYSNGDYNGAGSSDASTNIYRIALNGVYEYEAESIIPFAKVGLGYETMSSHWSENVDSPFIDMGAGVKIPLMEQFALKLEAVYMIKANDARWDNNLALLAGLNFSFGAEEAAAIASDTSTKDDKHAQEKAAEEEKARQEALAQQKEAEAKQEAAAQAEAKAQAEAAAAVTAAAAIANADNDKDGIKNADDLCKETPQGLEVDENGCALKRDFQLNFEHGSAVLDADSKAKVLSFLPFLKKNDFYHVKLIGHTDSTGAAKANQKLSEARAEHIRTLLIENGIASERLNAEGRGESEPVATNETKEGRHANRRIEVQLSK